MSSFHQVHESLKRGAKLEAAGGQATTYQVTAMFNGTNPQMRNLTVTDPTGQDYAACTTMQFDYKPSMNTATLTVEAPKTDVTVDDVKILPRSIRRWMQEEYDAEAERSTVTVSPPKTQEQTQQEAQNRGWLITWNEFTWCWPFYRIHFNVTVASFSLHAAFNPVLPGGEEMQWKGIESFSELSADAIGEVRLDLFGLFAQYVIARLASSVNPAIAIITEAVKFAVQATDLYRDWNDKTALLASSIINFLMAVIAIKIDLAGKFLLAICSFLVDVASRILRAVFETFLSVVAKAMVIVKPLGGWLDIIEAGGDIALGAVGLARWGGVL